MHMFEKTQKKKRLKKRKKKSQVGKNSINCLIYYKLIIFNILRVLLIYKNSFVLSTCNVSNVFSSVNLQVFRARKSRKFLVALTIYYFISIIIESREVCRSIYLYKHIFL